MKIDDASLLAYVDGELTPQENARIEEAIAASEELASRVTMLRASQLPMARPSTSSRCRRCRNRSRAASTN
ncbi:zf-HC2 domain-containing protein [Burkholderia gladioli]|uniref:zf-HC2 domain-containing protein n=1 Tax=Burkholderia gladioli TaxID=28095 RepID=UPI0020B1F4E8|nr:zf-HC2 domain-containing protein [Burkholderia gladioli]